MHALLEDPRHEWRGLRFLVFRLLMVLMLAMGIAGTVAVFSALSTLPSGPVLVPAADPGARGSEAVRVPAFGYLDHLAPSDKYRRYPLPATRLGPDAAQPRRSARRGVS